MKRPTADPYVISRAKKSGRWSWWCNRIYCDAYQTDLPTEAVAGLVDAGVIADDSLVVALDACKLYADLPGAVITITQPPAGEAR